MSFTAQQVIDAARTALNDSTKVRYADTELLGYVVEALRQMVILRPDQFTVYDLVVCAAGVKQAIPDGFTALLDVYAVKTPNPRGVTRCDLGTLRQFRSSWSTDPAGPCQHWMYAPDDPKEENPRSFFVYPPSPVNQVLNVLMTKVPTPPASLSDAVPVPDPYMAAFTFYVIGRAEAKDDEHINTNRAQTFLGMFKQLLGEAAAMEKAAP